MITREVYNYLYHTINLQSVDIFIDKLGEFYSIITLLVDRVSLMPMN
jgi:hypothetical protein